jgi:hypothetical protein
MGDFKSLYGTTTTGGKAQKIGLIPNHIYIGSIFHSQIEVTPSLL